jgi:hypothetical protein
MTPEERDETIKAIHALCDEESPPSPEAVFRAVELIEATNREPDIPVPSVSADMNGNIRLEWWFCWGLDVAIVVFTSKDTDTASYHISEKDGQYSVEKLRFTTSIPCHLKN